MEPELTQAFSTLSSQISDVGRDARSAANLSKENAFAISTLQGDVSNIKKHVFGSDPPPAAPPSRAPGAPSSSASGNGAVAYINGTRPASVVGRVSETEADIDGLHGSVLAVSSETALIKNEVAEIKKAIAAQSKTMGIAPLNSAGSEPTNLIRFWTFLTSREGLNFVVRIATLIGVAYGAAYAAAHGTPPGPWGRYTTADGGWVSVPPASPAAISGH